LNGVFFLLSQEEPNMTKIIDYKQIGRLAFPVIVAQSTVLITGLIDLAFIGPYGTEAIAAVSLANALCATLFNFLEGFRLGTTVLAARAAADDDKAGAAAVVNCGLFLVAALGALFIAAAPSGGAAVYAAAGNALIAYHGTGYLTVWLWALPLILCTNVLVGLFRGLRDTTTPLYGTFIICLLNIFFDYLFVCGGFGFPVLGVEGAAWGTLLANAAGLLAIVWLAATRPAVRSHINLRQPFGKHLRRYVRLAADIGLNAGATLLALLLFVWIIKPLGAAALAVHQITLQAFNLAYLPAVGFLVTASILVPPLLESRRNHLLAPTVARIGQLSLAVALVVSSLLFAFAPAAARFFSPADEAVAAQAAQTLRLVCLGQLFASVYMVLRGALTGCGDTSFIVGEGLVSGYIVFLPLAYLLAIETGHGIFGGYAAFVLWCATDCAALAFRFRSRRCWLRPPV